MNFTRLEEKIELLFFYNVKVSKVSGGRNRLPGWRERRVNWAVAFVQVAGLGGTWVLSVGRKKKGSLAGWLAASTPSRITTQTADNFLLLVCFDPRDFHHRFPLSTKVLILSLSLFLDVGFLYIPLFFYTPFWLFVRWLEQTRDAAKAENTTPSVHTHTHTKPSIEKPPVSLVLLSNTSDSIFKIKEKKKRKYVNR